MEEILASLEQREGEAERLVQELDFERGETTRLKAELVTREKAVRQAEREAEGRARDDARKLLLEARAEVEEAKRLLRNSDRPPCGSAHETLRRSQRETAFVFRRAGRAGPSPRSVQAVPSWRSGPFVWNSHSRT